MKRVIVTGASGFIGSEVVPQLTARGYEVHALTRSGARTDGDVTWHRADLAQHDAVRALVREIHPTHVLHLAWETSHGSYYTTPRNEDWLRDSIAFAEACLAAGARRIVGAGTGAEYDLHTGRTVSEDETPVRPNGLYGECKAKLHEHLERRGHEAGAEVAWGRIFFCYGPREHPSRPIPRLIIEVLAGRRVPFQAGKGVRDYLHVHDVARAFAALLDSRVEGPLNVGSGEGIALRDLVERFAAAAGAPGAVDFGALPTPGYEPMFVVADVRRLREEVGWLPKISRDEGVRETVAWWRRQVSCTGGPGGMA